MQGFSIYQKVYCNYWPDVLAGAGAVAWSHCLVAVPLACVQLAGVGAVLASPEQVLEQPAAAAPPFWQHAGVALAAGVLVWLTGFGVTFMVATGVTEPLVVLAVCALAANVTKATSANIIANFFMVVLFIFCVFNLLRLFQWVKYLLQ